ncbi:MAG: glycosyltransferase family 9 protein [Elusimicrobiota bacterium]|jgi:ADP-heptose:LPS heptosyltransferase|nr:glycosyltransferase family 9 protein [Elusimicrobiota bacterium]
MNKKIQKVLDKISLDKRKINFVIFRTDRIGDVVLSIGVAEILKKYFENSYITFIVKNYTRPILENNIFIDKILTIDNLKYKEIADVIKYNDISISLYASKDAVYAPYIAKIPIRIGPYSKIRSLFFNIRIKQNRSKSIKNEAQYNIDLVNETFEINGFAYPKIFLTDEEKDWGKKYLENNCKINVSDNEKFIILHPGSGGSSKDLPFERYLEIVQYLKKQNIKFLISGNNKELDFYKKKFLSNEKYKYIIKDDFFKKELPLRKFFSVMNFAKIFISNSTGPLHCASALGVQTISFYPNLKACNALRWGPFAEKKHENFVFSPDIPACQKCKNNCKYYPCMDYIDIKKVFDKILAFYS